ARGCRGLGFGLRGGRRRAAAALGRRLLRRGGLLVGIAAVVGLVEARALEQDRGAGPNLAPELRRLALGADGLRVGLDRLERLELVAAGVADIVVRGHGSIAS